MSDQPHTDERISLAEPLREICSRLDVPYDYVKEIVFTPAETTVTLYHGSEGRGRGSKFLDRGKPVTETLLFRTRSY